jgi:hypothetical protein
MEPRAPSKVMQSMNKSMPNLVSKIFLVSVKAPVLIAACNIHSPLPGVMTREACATTVPFPLKDSD